MIRRFALLAAALSTCMATHAQYRMGAYGSLSESETVTALREHVSYLSSAALEGRGAGSEGEKDAAAYVSEQFASCGLDVLSGAGGELFGLKRETGDTLTSRNVVAFIPGYDRELRNKYIVIGARLDNIGTVTTNINGTPVKRVFPGANGNASGLALLLELGKRLQINKVLFKRSVLLVAFGASSIDNAGSWYFLNRSYSKQAKDMDVMVNLDMLGSSSGFYAYTCSNPDLNAVISRMRGTLQPLHPQIVSKEPVRSDHRQFYASGIPSVFFTTGMYPEYNSERDDAGVPEYDNMERVLEYLYNFSVELANGEKPLFDSASKESAAGGGKIPQYYNCDRRPTFLGNSDPGFFLKKWVYVYLKYPRKAVMEGIQGRVLVGFTIDEHGKVGDVQVLRGVDPVLDDEAVRVIEASPDWKPARMDGKAVKCAMSLYIEFKLEKNKR